MKLSIIAFQALTMSSSLLWTVNAFAVLPPSTNFRRIIGSSHQHSCLHMADSPSPSANIVSPFDDSNADSMATTATTVSSEKSLLPLTWENVDMVLDEMRPYLIQDGGNVAIKAIDGPIVRIEMQGACGNCPSSTQTIKMGLERGLKERIPEIKEVVQSLPEGPPLDAAQVDIVLAGVRPFLQVAGGTIELDQITGVNGLQPTIQLHMKGSSASLNSVKQEISARLRRHFLLPMLRVEWK